jgi:hypothetical protein
VPDRLDRPTPLEEKIFNDWNRYGERTMATPISKGGPLDKPQAKAVHPGFYKGDDAVEWARNQAALRRHQLVTMREGMYADTPVVQQSMVGIEAEAAMFEALVKKAGG